MSLSSLAAQSGVRTMGVAIRGDATDLSRALAKSATEVEAWEKKTSGSADRWASKWKVAAAGVALTLVAIVAGLGQAALSAVDFERNMRNVNSLLLVSDARLGAISERVLDIAREVPQSAENLAEGLYNIASSGFVGADGLLVLEASARAASAGLSTTDTAAEAISAVLNAYGLSAASAGDVSDALFQTVNKGVVSFDELSSVVGNFVGMAAAAGVPINDASAALATMTLGGIGAAEASTSLNRVMQSLIQPSEALQVVLRELGYESGLQALQTEGLYGIMEQLRQVTDGNAEAYLRLFPEIRAARGAFALAADDGRAYAQAQSDIGDKTRVAGATQIAFNEQMKSTAAQWDILTSSIAANTIQIGQKVLPLFNNLLQAINPLANQVIPTLADAWSLVSPYMETAADIGEDLWTILTAIYDAGMPIVGLLAQIGGALAGLGLDIVLNVLEAVTSVMAENQTITVALAAAYLSRFLPSLGSMITAVSGSVGALRAQIAAQMEANRQMLVGIGTINGYNGSLSATRVLALQAGAAIRGTGTALRTSAAASIASSGALAVLTAGLVALVYAAQQAGQAVAEEMARISGDVNTFNVDSLQSGVDQINEVRDSLGGVAEEGTKLDKWYEYLAPTTQFIDMFNDYRHNKALDETNKALEEIGSKAANSNLNLVRLYQETGVEISVLKQIVESQGIDITDAVSTENAAASREQVKQYLQDIERQTGVSTANIAGDFSNNAERIEAFAKAIEDATNKAAQAFLSASDVIGSWKPNIGVEEEADALERLGEARTAYNDLMKDSGRSAEDVTAAQKRVTDAEAALTEAQAAKAAGTLQGFYENAIATGESFSRNLDRAVQMGLDPAIVTRLLQEGPEQAGPIVEQMVADNTGALIQMVNDAETQLAEINQRVVEQARLTALAVNAETDEMTYQLADALTISGLKSEGTDNVADIAKVTGLTQERVREVAENFNIQLRDGISQTVVPYTQDYAEQMGLGTNDGAEAGRRWGEAFRTALGAAIATGTATPSVGRPTTGGGKPIAWASGTSQVLPGYTPGKDVHRFYSPTAGWLDLSGGEGIARPEVVAAMGAARFNALNAAARTGGINAVRRAMMPYLGGFANGTASLRVQPVTVPVRSTHTTEAPMHVERMYVNDPGDGYRAARKSRALDQIGGRRGH